MSTPAASTPLFKSAGLVFVSVLLASSVIAQPRHDTTSYIQTVDLTSGKIDTILVAKGDFEAPNWHPDNYLVPNFRGKIYKLDLATKQLTEINTAPINQIMDDHGLSPDGKWIAITSFDTAVPSKNLYKFSISIVPATGGQPKKITTSQDLSFWHGWSPDGRTIAYCGGDFTNLDVYTIPLEGGVPKRLTETPGLDDGPDYSPDGKYIYFHSYRSGRMQIWRMHADGSQPEQLTFDENANWFPHPSPDNKWMVYIAYTSDEKQNHPFGKNVKLRLMNLKTKVIKDITPVFFGGAGTINTPTWSPDSRKIAFVSYSVSTNTLVQSNSGLNYFKGKWSVLVKGTPDGDARLIVDLQLKLDSLSGIVQDSTGKDISKISSVQLTDTSVTVHFTAQGYEVDLVMIRKDDDNVTGSLMGMFDAEGRRIKSPH